MPEQPARSGLSDALTFTIVIQLLVCIFTGLILDGGVLNRFACYCSLFFWASVFGAAVVAGIRGGRKLTATDFGLLKYGYVLILALMVPLNVLVAILKGVA